MLRASDDKTGFPHNGRDFNDGQPNLIVKDNDLKFKFSSLPRALFNI